MLSQAMQFMNITAKLLVSLACQGNGNGDGNGNDTDTSTGAAALPLPLLPLPVPPPAIFSSVPQHLVEDMVDLVIFVSRGFDAMGGGRYKWVVWN